MKEHILEEIELPAGIKAELDGEILVLSKDGKNLKRDCCGFVYLKDKKIILEAKKGTKREKKMINTLKAHIENMVSGLEEGFVYRLKICSVHFPMSVNKEGNKIVIKNFLGERIPRQAEILPNVEVEIDKDIIEVKSQDKESAGQTAANIEKCTKIKAKDRRIFQDGIFITEKPGRKI